MATWLKGKSVSNAIVSITACSFSSKKSTIFCSLFVRSKNNLAEGIAKAKAKGSYLGRSKGSSESVEVFTNKASTKAILKYLKMNESISGTAKLSQTSEGSVKKVKRLIKEGLIELY